MFILEEGLPLVWDLFWIMVCIPFLYYGYKKTYQIRNSRHMEMMVVSGIVMLAVTTMLIMYDNPLLTGNAVPTVLTGYYSTGILTVFVLLFIKLFTGIGGFLSMGANVFAIGIAGPYLGYQTFKILEENHVHQIMAITLAVIVTEMSTILVSCLQLAIAYHYPTFQDSLMGYINMYIVNYPLQIVMVLIVEIVICNVIIAKRPLK